MHVISLPTTNSSKTLLKQTACSIIVEQFIINILLNTFGAMRDYTKLLVIYDHFRVQNARVIFGNTCKIRKVMIIMLSHNFLPSKL